MRDDRLIDHAGTLLRASPTPLTAGEIAAALGERAAVLSAILGRAARRGEIRLVEPGRPHHAARYAALDP